LTLHSARSQALPVASARGITVLWVPFLAFVSHAKPTHQRIRMQADRPSRGTELMSSGVSKGCRPSRSAAGFRISYSRGRGWSGGIGSGFLRGPLNGSGSTSPLTPISRSAFSYQGSMSAYEIGQSSSVEPSMAPYVERMRKSCGMKRQAWPP
jgi:hypothetical protein